MDLITASCTATFRDTLLKCYSTGFGAQKSSQGQSLFAKEHYGGRTRVEERGGVVQRHVWNIPALLHLFTILRSASGSSYKQCPRHVLQPPQQENCFLPLKLAGICEEQVHSMCSCIHGGAMRCGHPTKLPAPDPPIHRHLLILHLTCWHALNRTSLNPPLLKSKIGHTDNPLLLHAQSLGATR